MSRLVWLVAALLLCLWIACGCALRWNGQERFAIDPDADLWIHHPQVGATNSPTP